MNLSAWKSNSLKFLFLATLMVVSQSFGQLTANTYGETISSKKVFNVYMTFSDTVTEVEPTDFTVTNGTVLSVTSTATNKNGSVDGKTSKFFTAVISASNPGDVTFKVNASSVKSTTGKGNNTESNVHTVKTSFDPQMKFWEVKSDADWAANKEAATGLDFKNDMADPSGTTASFTSVTKKFTEKMKAQNVTFKQSDVWNNWTEIPKIGPNGAGDAVILLTPAKGEYYFFGKATGGYKVWKNVDPTKLSTSSAWGSAISQVTNKSWMTSADIKDGIIYSIFDLPNDQDPALFVDSNITDGKLGTFFGNVFNDPSNGSDASLFRNDEDGLFHIIYEDWSFNDASSQAWDSPVAGHTSAADPRLGADPKLGFIPHEHSPAVDIRTTFTGKTAKMARTHLGKKYDYDVYSPKQDAYGDWNTMKIGSELYLFGDRDPANNKDGRSGMSIGRFHSSSIYQQFTYQGFFGLGSHPDPSSGFMEGEFYVISQDGPNDHKSTGPWVEEVQARAGVDTDGDGTVDQWTAFQKISEAYGYKKGYGRVYTRAPAQIDLSSLPEGLGFKFEFKIDNKAGAKAKPIMDDVVLTYKSVNPSPIYAGGDAPQAIFSAAVNKNKLNLNYYIELGGKVKFEIYNLQGDLIKSFKQTHGTSGAKTLGLDVSLPTGVKIVQFTNPEGKVFRSTIR